MKTQGLLQALDRRRLRRRVRRRPARRGEVAREGARLLVPRSHPSVGPEEPAARALESLQRSRSTRARASASSRCRTGPSSTSGSTSTSNSIPVVPLYFAAVRPVVERDGMLVMVDDDRLPLAAGRGRCSSGWSGSARSAAIRSRAPSNRPAATVPEIIEEMLVATTSERQGRAIDHDESGSMEQKKKEGYF